MVARSEFPTRQNCDPTNPEEAFLWMFAALPHVRGAPLIMPLEYYRHISRRLWDLGARPVAEPTLEWVPPTSTEAHWMTSPGRWVPAGTAPTVSEEDLARSAIDKMSRQQKTELLHALEAEADGRPLPDTPAGKIANLLTFGQRDVVLTILRGQRSGE